MTITFWIVGDIGNCSPIPPPAVVELPPVKVRPEITVEAVIGAVCALIVSVFHEAESERTIVTFAPAPIRLTPLRRYTCSTYVPAGINTRSPATARSMQA